MAEALSPHEKIDELLKLLEPKRFQPFVRRAADDFYEELITVVQDYLRDNADFNLRSDIDQARASVRYHERQLHEISDALGVSAYSQEARLGRIKALKERATEQSA